jgi:hypothetical protein
VVYVETPSGDEDNKRGGVVVLENGERVPYAALVLAPGSRWADPFNMPRTKLEVDAYVNTWRNNFKKAKHVLFIGGGSLSVGKILVFQMSTSFLLISFLNRVGGRSQGPLSRE